MMNYDLLNEMTEYIEAHLTDEIDNKKLSQIVGVSFYSLQRIFIFLTGMSISEYIRKRRLSRAYEELKNSDIRIADLAVKYNYESPVSFSRAFKQYFKMTPGECRQSGGRFVEFPVMRFREETGPVEDVSYEIKDIDEKTIYCFRVSADTHEDYLYRIRELYKGLGQKFDIEKLEGFYGISFYENDEYVYYAGSERQIPGTEEYVIKAGKCAVFNAGSDNQKDIVKVYDYVYRNWIDHSAYEISDRPAIEYYTDNNCFVYFKIRNKQN